MGKITKITEKIIQQKEVGLPIGNYSGIWGGSIIDVHFNNKHYELETEEGVRGMGYKVIVFIEKDKMHFLEVKN